ncbi:MAG: hypothetical protein OXB98_03720 [Bryobacterales bacterium]|nr:hypothetical protein [Bryobacterales bacterium]
MNTSKTVLLIIACLLVGWTVQAQMEPAPPADTIPLDLLEKLTCRYEIVNIPDTGPAILLNQCTGESWWYDAGSEPTDSFRSGRPRSWQPLPMERPAE